MRWLPNSVRFVVVTVGIVVLTSLSIDATEVFNSSQSALGILAKKATTDDCPSGMVLITLSDKSFCIDTYEVSVGASCPVATPAMALQTKENIDSPECQGVSEAEKSPWTSVTLLQAKEICAKRGGRLPSNGEWFEAALGTPDTDACNSSGELQTTGANGACRSPRGIYDAIGNAWEWIDARVVDGVYDGQPLPEEGYVAEVDATGVPRITSQEAQTLMNEDYFWSAPTGEVSMMRGGFYGSDTDGGVYAVHSKVTNNFSSAAIGFRCVLDR